MKSWLPLLIPIHACLPHQKYHWTRDDDRNNVANLGVNQPIQFDRLLTDQYPRHFRLFQNNELNMVCNLALVNFISYGLSYFKVIYLHGIYVELKTPFILTPVYSPMDTSASFVLSNNVGTIVSKFES